MGNDMGKGEQLATLQLPMHIKIVHPPKAAFAVQIG